MLLSRVLTDIESRLANRWISCALLCALILLPVSRTVAQTLNDFNLLGGPDSSLVPTKSAEPKLTATLTPAQDTSAEGTMVLSVRVDLAPGAYTYSQNPSFGGATKITVTELYGLEPIDEQFTPDHPPKVIFEELFDQEVEKFPGGVTWQGRYRLTGTVPPEEVTLEGTISYQVCDDQSCRPLQETFVAFPESPVHGRTAAGEPPLAPMSSEPADVVATTQAPVNEPSVSGPAQAEQQTDEATLEFNTTLQPNEASLPWYLLAAFAGGLLLNIMPCVLPVLAIKVMSFVQQAGESRGRVLALNLSYSLGVIGVFLGLASLAIFPQILGEKFGWGGLFQLPEFNLGMICLVFAMGLSLLGVFEIPIPGLVGSTGGQHREGLLGACMIGMFATLLATPCSGPFMTPVLAWSVKQEPQVVYLIWGLMGLGMASPFLAVGFVPSVAKFIPRPGDWMVRFKEFCGFTLLGTAIWLMYSLPSEVIVPTLIMLLGLALGLWMVGSLYDHTSSVKRKMTVRFYALLTTGLICWFGFDKYREGEILAAAESGTGHVAMAGDLPWEPFTGDRLRELLREGRPVLIDFTADWCLVCKQNEKVALNTEATNAFVRANGVVTLYADYTRQDEEIRQWLEKFGSISVPLTVVFPEGNPQNPHILDGPYTQSTLLNVLEKSVAVNVDAKGQQSARLEQASRQ